MDRISWLVLLLLLAPQGGHAQSDILVLGESIVDAYLLQLRSLLTEILFVTANEGGHCFIIITDDLHRPLYNGEFFASVAHASLRSHFMLHLADAEDPLRRKQQPDCIWLQLRAAQCQLQIVTIANGVQVKRLMRYVDQQRALNMRGKFVFLHDVRLFERDLWTIWYNIPAAIFLKHSTVEKDFTIYGFPFPSILNGLVSTRKLHHWQWGKRLPKLSKLFPHQMLNNDWQGIELRIAVIEHAPMVMKVSSNDSTMDLVYTGVEVEISKTVAKALNFRPLFYASADADVERWGRALPNGSFTGLLAELANYRAHLAIGDLHQYELYYSTLDLSWPHTVDCLTFLTPESTADDTWRTLIQPFSAAMWTGVLVSLFLVGSIFYLISYLNELARRPQASSNFFHFMRRSRATPLRTASETPNAFGVEMRRMLIRLPAATVLRPDLFDDYANCILLTYSMLLYVALPRMPRNWPLRVLTGWFWIYCILVTVTYRASLTAILANPVKRITIDTLEGLRHSRITTAAGGEVDKLLFTQADDELARQIGENMEIIEKLDGMTERIAKGKYAYYDSKDFLHHMRLSSGRQSSATEEVLHVMTDCAVSMPVSIGMVRNSALKPHIDKALQRLREGGLLTKWQQDFTETVHSGDKPAQEAVMNLNKIWSSFVALAVGLFFACCAGIAELLHYRYVVRRHPFYDEYNRNLYYNYKRMPHTG